jgi:hypothetical protein
LKRPGAPPGTPLQRKYQPAGFFMAGFLYFIISFLLGPKRQLLPNETRRFQLLHLIACGFFAHTFRVPNDRKMGLPGDAKNGTIRPVVILRTRHLLQLIECSVLTNKEIDDEKIYNVFCGMCFVPGLRRRLY